MSVSHPVLRQLKEHVKTFCQISTNGGQITDTHSSLLPFCQTLEDVLVGGLRYYTRAEGGPWKWAKLLGDVFPTYKLTAPLRWCIDETVACKHVLTDVGRTRLFIRCALKKGVLALALRLLREEKKLLRTFYHTTGSIVGDEILFELFASMVSPLSQCKFSLFIKNATFLDETWELPLYVMYELVPTERLGVEITFVRGRVLVTDVEPGSVCDEDAKVEPGDVIDYLFGECMRNAGKRKFTTLMRDYRGAPVYIGVVKAITSCGSVFQSLIPLLAEVGLPVSTVLNKHKKRRQELQEFPEYGDQRLRDHEPVKDVTENAQSGSNGQWRRAQLVDEQGHYPVTYLGQTNVGPTGTIDKIECGVIDVLRNYNALPDEEKEERKLTVVIDLGETDVLVACAKTNKAILQHGYPEIASCGRRKDYPLHFAYVAGETTCTLANNFTCFVFEANCEEQAQIILKEIARGFDRTHWAV